MPKSVEEASYLVATAIATAEGYFSADHKVIPFRANNPGDLVLGNRYKLGVLGEGITIFPRADKHSSLHDPADGWAWLRRMVIGWFELKSHIYHPSMTILEIAGHYTKTNQVSWAKIVSEQLKIKETDTLETVLAT